ncbi:Putative DnaJ domain, Zinc finger C2H2-type, Chaperone J-domain superfamily [Colletotrichum destructivum]|uniref:DnaJ domain, Zinc finger C2H2-type, Chaperone J-domain superfamily n=1 Tax=Colletotrichum destructivum TaxID=34406 RepID=A0AAX4I0G9_9PEZI|nr:Putative DnaJ domain, Zinc finger C2H2-type, Chaperone J-domain superfamily [Colletotrichum destructivum]
MLFSPFDALGLSWGAYDSRQIKLAYKRAALVCHPDKRNQNDIRPHRWPQMWHLEQARDYLLHARAEALEKFKGFPQTFFSHKDELPYFRVPQPLPDHLGHCEICEVVVLLNEFNEHLREHQQTICSVCDKRVPLDDIGDHVTRLHGYRTCHHCGTHREPSEHQDHIVNYHQCPLCDVDEPFIIDHLVEAHQLYKCDDCGGNNPVTHLITVHPASECTGCGQMIFDDSMLDHLRKDHGLTLCRTCHVWETVTELWGHVFTNHGLDRCLLCMASFVEGGLDAHLVQIHDIRPCVSCPPGRSFDMEHVLDQHGAEQCTECNTSIQSDRVRAHLIAQHKWLLCDVCGLTSPNLRVLGEHQEQHPICDICNERVAQEIFQRHLKDRHGLICCPLCDKAFSPAGLPRHFQMVHNQTELCPDCHFTGTKDDLNHHVIESHGWLHCRFCDEICPDIELRTSHEENVHDVHPCWHCDQVISEGQMRSHQIEEHGYTSCSFCPSLSKDISSHIQRHQEEAAPIHHQLSVFNDKLQQLAALGPRSKVHLQQAAEYIQKALRVESQVTALNHRGVVSPERAQPPQTQGVPLSSVRTEQPLSSDEPGEGSPFRTTEKCYSNRGADDDNSLRRSGRQQSGCKRTPAHSLGSRVPYRKKPRNSVAQTNGLDGLLKDVTRKETVRGFVEVVTSSNHSFDRLQLQEIRHASQGTYRSLSLISRYVEKCERGVGLTKMCQYYALMQMAQLLDRTKEESGRQRVDSAELDKILEHRKRENNDYNRNKLRNQIQLGRKLQRIVGPFVGLLCFLAVGQADLGKSLSFTDGELKRFHSQIRGHGNLWTAGSRYLRLLHNGTTQGTQEIKEITGLVHSSNCW